MILHSPIFLVLLVPILCQNSTKTKRTLHDEGFGGDPRAVLFYMETPPNPANQGEPELQAQASQGIRNFYPGASGAKPLALVSVQQPIQVFEQDSPKQVAEQQVLYEFQQTPTDAVSNVRVKQFFQPSSIDITTAAPDDTSNSPFLASGSFLNPPRTQQAQATFVQPVSHNIFTNHGLTPTNFNYNPLGDQSYLSTQISPPKPNPGKYIYLNGKIVYSPSHIIPQSKPQNNIYHKGLYHNQQKLPLLNNQFNNPFNQRTLQNQNNQRKPVQQPQQYQLPPITKNKFQPPKQLQQIDKPSAPVQQQQQEEEAEEEQEKEASEEEDAGEETNEEEEDDGEDASSENQEVEAHEDYEPDSFAYESFPYEEEYHHDDYEPFFKYRPKRKNRQKDEEEEEEEEDEEDSKDTKETKKSASKHKPRKYRNLPKENVKGYHESYSSNMKYNSNKPPNKKKNSKKPSGKFKKVKFTKVGKGKPKIETIEGRFSENIPVTHKHKVYKERWFLTKEGEGRKPLK